MAGLIDDNIINEILGRVNIVEVISEYIPLKKSGRNFKTNCPFHHEKTASFMVSVDKQIYHCFGCGAGGNVFNFLMQYERLQFPEAVELLAKKTGVTLPERKQGQRNPSGVTTEVYRVNELAAEYYSANLNAASGHAGREYLVKRGITKETAGLFRLGLASDKWDGLLNYLQVKSVSVSLMEKAGLVLPRDDGGHYDRFRNRVIFTISDVKSQVVGFGARVLDNSLPKYINSPESPVYTKGKHLFGFDLAKEAVRAEDCIVVVEGNLDCIVPYQAGLHNIAASLGTALTSDQVRLIKRYTHNAVIMYDGDKAGEMATLRSLDIFVEEGMNVRVAALPAGFDPDTFVRKHGIDRLKEMIAKADNLFDYKMRVLKAKFDIRQIEGKAGISAEMLPTINKFANAILRSEYLKKLSLELNVSEDALMKEAGKASGASGLRGAEQRPAAGISLQAANPTEKLLVKFMLEETRIIAQLKEKIEPCDFQDTQISRIVSLMFDFVTAGRELKPNALINHLEDNNLSQLLRETSFYLPEVEYPDKDKVIEECVQRLKKNSLIKKKHRLQQEIKKAETERNENELNNLKEEFNRLIKKG
ncbi:MAG: DNA primase [Candidatus Omnitrophica bacterium]|nr:DNA primase [Candidatus Omnitrophota bacterium]MDD5079138.1 DNA primase [Candidatus Omnitrophota bacterium]